MYAVVEIGGKHYKVEKDSDLMIDFLASSKEGDKVKFDGVTLFHSGKDILIGKPFVDKVTVEGKVLVPEVKGEKLTVFKYKQKAHYRRKTGHRQKYTRIQITSLGMK
jgi:large subunit ribosomal protein L21